MSQTMRMLARLTLLSIATSVLTIAPAETAIAAESIPNLQWPAVEVGGRNTPFIESPTGSITLACTHLDRNLETYDASGQKIREINQATIVDGVSSCITDPAIDKNDDVYGIPSGLINGSWVYGPNLIAYSGDTVKWKYPIACGSNASNNVIVGANGNIYATTSVGGDVRLVGLTPEAVVGTIQPKKILDVALPNDCSIQLEPYKDGIKVHGQSSPVQFYNYNGTLVGTSPISDIWYEKLNADGQLFIGSLVYVSNNSYSASVKRYDPRDGTVQTTSVSTSGANVSDINIFPLSDGGVLAQVKERKVIGGVPVIPAEYIRKIVTVNGSGSVINSIELSDTYSQNGATGTFDPPHIYPESNGKVVIVRTLGLDTNISWPRIIPAIAIGVYDPIANTWGDQFVMQGDMSKSGGPSGYSFDASYKVSLASGSVRFVAQCSNNCTNYNYMMYSVALSEIGVKYPETTVANSQGRPTAKYIALGDSFSSGEGAPPFEADTNTPNVNTCHRSTVAYPRIIAGSNVSIPALSEDSFRACSGAITANVTDIEQWNENIQLDWRPDATTEVVTITIGGNDIGFGSFAEACVMSSCDTGTAAYNSTLNKINNELPGKLEATYKNILRYAPNAKIYVAGYPQVVADKSVNDPDDIRCIYMQDGSSKFGDARAARSIVTKLNEKIANTISSVRGEDVDNLRLRFVDVNQTSSPFAGHEVCGYSPTSWFQNVDQGTNDYAYIFHPNELGQEAYATIIGAAISAG